MKRRILLGAAAAAGVAAFGSMVSGPRTAALTQARGTHTPVIVELFTSEGCSDCPPADALATRLKQTQPVPGAQIIVLGQHVDYWNNARWSDRFSPHTFSVRQEGYARRFHLDSPYTPQIVVDGRTEFVGSDANRAEQVIKEAARAPKADVRLSGDANGVQVRITQFPAAETGAVCDVILAVTEDGLRSQIGGGENEGRALTHSAVVRSWRVMGTATASPATVFEASAPVGVLPEWRRKNLQAVVFLQARASGHILGAASGVL